MDKIALTAGALYVIVILRAGGTFAVGGGSPLFVGGAAWALIYATTGLGLLEVLGRLFAERTALGVSAVAVLPPWPSSSSRCAEWSCTAEEGRSPSSGGTRAEDS